MSNQRGRRRLRPKMRRPIFQRNSENVPTGQSQEQKAFFRKQAHQHEADEEEHGGRVDLRHAAGEEQVFRVHQPGDGQPAFHSGGSRDTHADAAALKVASPQVELETEPGVHDQKHALHDVARALGAVGREAADKGLFGFRNLQWMGSHVRFSRKPKLRARRRKRSDLCHTTGEAKRA